MLCPLSSLASLSMHSSADSPSSKCPPTQSQTPGYESSSSFRFRMSSLPRAERRRPVVKTLVFIGLLAQLGGYLLLVSSLPQYLQRYLRGDLPERKKIEGAESFSRTETQVGAVQLRIPRRVRGGTAFLFATTRYERTMFTLARGAIRASRWTCSWETSIPSTLTMSFRPSSSCSRSSPARW